MVKLTPLPQANNEYHGSRTALWLFGFLILMKTAISLNCIFNGRVVASSADGIPLDTYALAVSQAVIYLFALWGVGQLVLCLLCLLVLFRYRAMTAVMLAMLLLDHIGRRLVLEFLPIVKSGSSPGSVVNLALLVLMIAALALSLWDQRKHPTISHPRT
jgi:hypothetical protein